VLVRFVAPGLTFAERRRRPDGRMQIVMAVKTTMETVVLSQGHVLRFQMSDSIWPEVTPPPVVTAWLRHAWGMQLSFDCRREISARPAQGASAGWPASPFFGAEGEAKGPPCPLSVWHRRWRDVLPPYWWLRLLRAAPPNPSVLHDRRRMAEYVHQVLGVRPPV
jgi:hypothetical protein